MVRFWLGFWNEHRDVLLDGELDARHPEALYPLVIASNERTRLIALYEDVVAPTGAEVPGELFLVNATRGNRVVLELTEPIGPRRLEVRDCQGEVVGSDEVRLDRGLHAIAVPPAGLATIKA
jgi:alpha-galactosidase